MPRARGDDFSSPLTPGLRASEDAQRLASELAFGAGRLAALVTDPPGTYARVAGVPEADRAAALAFLIVYLGPLEEADPFAAIEELAPEWERGAVPDLTAARLGPRASHDPARGARTLEAFRAWAARWGSSAAAFTGDGAWSAERRFDRIYERLALPGFGRSGRYELLVVLGRLSRFDLRPGALRVDGADQTSLGAKRVFGIGEERVIERRAADLTAACDVPLEALDLALANWHVGARMHAGFGDAVTDAGAQSRAQAALGL